MDKDSIIEVWVDASVSQESPRQIGFACVWTDGRTINSNTTSVDVLSRTDSARNISIIAETLAATYALRIIPINSLVKLHSDRLEVASLLQGWDFHRKAAQRKKFLDRLYQKLLKQTELHRAVTVRHTIDCYDPNMKMAHNLANSARKLSYKEGSKGLAII